MLNPNEFGAFMELSNCYEQYFNPIKFCIDCFGEGRIPAERCLKPLPIYRVAVNQEWPSNLGQWQSLVWFFFTTLPDVITTTWDQVQRVLERIRQTWQK